MKPRIKASRQDEPGADGSAEVEEITLSEQVYRLLRRDIMSGAFAPGQPRQDSHLRAGKPEPLPPDIDEMAEMPGAVDQRAHEFTPEGSCPLHYHKPPAHKVAYDLCGCKMTFLTTAQYAGTIG